ncbi:hypothetical protein FORC22_1418 [Vibrio parahaemolyticus]|nr:hypothetical protein FORC22_1418 [Vibrio parahaemolyticus]
MAFIGLCPGLVKTMLRAQKLDVEVATLKARKKVEKHVLIGLILLELDTQFGIN